MEAAPSPAIFQDALVVLGAAAIVIPIFHRLRISPVLGFVLIGFAVGPFGLGAIAGRLPFVSYVAITNREAIRSIADLGVVVLLFVIGLELSPERLKLMRRLIFGLGLFQFVLCGAAITGIGVLLGLAPATAAVVGLALAMSSTAIVIQVLAEKRKLTTVAGRASFAMLLFQDLAAAPALFAINALGSGAASLGKLGIVVVQAVIAIIAVIALGRLALRPLFSGVARTRSPELFMAACLLVILVTGMATAAAGLSMALGSLIAGLLLAETEYRRQVEVTIEPFKGLLVGIFLISVGMSLDFARLAGAPAEILGASAGVVALKLGIIAALARAFGLPWSAAVQSGLLLGPGGEFTFVIIGLAVSVGVVSQHAASFTLILATLTMAAIPVLSWLGDWLSPRLTRMASVDPTLLLPLEPDFAPGVIIAGFGRVGQVVGAMLDAHELPYVAIDSDVDRVMRQRAHGKRVYFGDMVRVDLLRRLNLSAARALVVTMDNPVLVDQLVAAVRHERPDLLIIARARDARHAAHLYRLGVSDAVPETIEASLQLSEAVLVDIGVAMGPVIVSIHEKRAELQAQIKAAAPEAEIRWRGRRRLRDVGPEKGGDDPI